MYSHSPGFSILALTLGADSPLSSITLTYTYILIYISEAGSTIPSAQNVASNWATATAWESIWELDLASSVSYLSWLNSGLRPLLIILKEWLIGLREFELQKGK